MGVAARGQVTHRELAEQGRDYSGLVFGTISPTDHDCHLEFRDRLHVFVEFKRSGAELSKGQRIAFRRMTRDLAQATDANGQRKGAIYLVAEHTQDRRKQIVGATAVVVEYCWCGEWFVPPRRMTVKETIDHVLPRFLRDELDLLP